MGKSNVNPDHYKVAGRERQGEDIAQTRNKQKHAENVARRRTEVGARPQTPVPEPGAALPGAPPTRAVKTPKQAAKKGAKKASGKPQGPEKRSKRSTAPKRGTSRNDIGALPVTGAVVGVFGRGLPRRRPEPRT